MYDTEVFGYQMVLSSHVIVDVTSWERSGGMIRRGGRLAIPEERSDDNEVFLWIERFVFPDEPEVVR